MIRLHVDRASTKEVHGWSGKAALITLAAGLALAGVAYGAAVIVGGADQQFGGPGDDVLRALADDD